MARPSKLTHVMAEKILAGLSDDKALSEICQGDKMPSERTVYRWVRDDDAFCQDYVRAREDQGHRAADKLIGLREKVESGELEPAAARFIMDSIKWESGKRAPGTFADKPIAVEAKVKVDDGESFGRIAGALERVAGAIAGGAVSTGRVVGDSEAGPTNA